MELETSGQISRITALDEEFTDTSVNIKKNLTRFATGIANYTLNFLNVGIFETTTETPLSTTLSTVSTSALSSSSLSTLLSSSSILSRENFTTTSTSTATTTLRTFTSSNSFLVASSTVPSLQNATETVFATLANGILDVITPAIYSYNGQQLSTTATATVTKATADTFIVNNSNAITKNIDSSVLAISNNGTEIRILDHAPQLSKEAMVKVYVLSVMAFLSLLGNIMTMWNIYKTRISRRNSRHSWSAIYSLIFHLSIADVLVTGFCIIGEAAWCYTVQWLADEITCKLVKFFQMFSLYLSTYVLVLIGVDRWIAVKYPMKSLNMAKRCYRLLGGTYVLSLLLSLPQSFIFHVARGPFVEEFYQCVTHGFYTAEWQEQLYTTFTLVFTFLLPLCILFGTYLSSFRTIASSEKMFQGSKLTTYSNKPTAQTNRQRLIHKAKMKSLRISVVIIFAFLICWTPYYVMMIIFMFWNPDKRIGDDLQSAIFFFGMSNSLVNPLIYGAFHLCPMKRKTGKHSHNQAHSLNRGDSQRTPSMLTAVTQLDSHGRQVRTYRPSYYRTQSNGSNSNYKEHVSLLQVTPTPSLMRKNTAAASFRSNGKGAVLSSVSNNSPHATAVLLSYDGGSSTNSTMNRCNSDSYCVQETLLGKHFIGSSVGGGAGVGVGNTTGNNDIGFSTKDHHSLVIGTNENISSV